MSGLEFSVCNQFVIRLVLSSIQKHIFLHPHLFYIESPCFISTISLLPTGSSWWSLVTLVISFSSLQLSLNLQLIAYSLALLKASLVMPHFGISPCQQGPTRQAPLSSVSFPSRKSAFTYSTSGQQKKTRKTGFSKVLRIERSELSNLRCEIRHE